MASAQQIRSTYDYMDELFRQTFGPHPDITGALFDGDFSKSLERAQRDKHRSVLQALRVEPGHRVLDVGCGWGPMLRTIADHGAVGVGLTLSPAQEQACRKDGLDARLLDWKDATPDSLGRFDAILSIGAFEHFASKEDFIDGRRDAVYRDFFALCHRLLPPGGRLFLDTMTWGEAGPKGTHFSLQAPRGSTERLLAVLERFYPGSWLPEGAEHVAACARPWFAEIRRRNGRADYIETMKRWGAVARPSPAKLWTLVKSLRFVLSDSDLRWKLESLRGSYNRICFERVVMDHFQFVFTRADPSRGCGRANNEEEIA